MDQDVKVKNKILKLLEEHIRGKSWHWIWQWFFFVMTTKAEAKTNKKLDKLAWRKLKLKIFMQPQVYSPNHGLAE